MTLFWQSRRALPSWSRCPHCRFKTRTPHDRVLDDMADWCNRPLDRVYPVVFIDAIVVKIGDGQVANRPVYTAIGVTVEGNREILGLWVGTGGEGAKYS